ncbi:hypothetical protein EV2_003709 [Malus domestica]
MSKRKNCLSKGKKCSISRWAKMRWKRMRMRSVEGEMTKQEAKEPHIPVKSSKLWLRSPGPAVPQTLIEAGNDAWQIDLIEDQWELK